MAPYLDDILQALATVLTRQRVAPQQLLMQNVCITLGRLGLVCGPQMSKTFGEYAKIWCQVMQNTRLDFEKVNAFQGLYNLIKANPQGCMTCIPELAGAICSFCPCPPQLQPNF